MSSRGKSSYNSILFTVKLLNNSHIKITGRSQNIEKAQYTPNIISLPLVLTLEDNSHSYFRIAGTFEQIRRRPIFRCFKVHLSFTEATKKTNNQAEIDQKLNNHQASKKSHIIFSLLLLQYSENFGKRRKFQIGDYKKLTITVAYFYRKTSETHSWTESQAFILLEDFSLETAF